MPELFVLVLLSLTAALVLVATRGARRGEQPRTTLRRMLGVGALFGAASLTVAWVAGLP